MHGVGILFRLLKPIFIRQLRENDIRFAAFRAADYARLRFTDSKITLEVSE